MTDLAVTSKLAPHKNSPVGPILAKNYTLIGRGTNFGCYIESIPTEDQFWQNYTYLYSYNYSFLPKSVSLQACMARI